jgi:type IV pilus assembly protein PilQ
MYKKKFIVIMSLLASFVFAADESSNIKDISFIQDGQVSKLIILFDKETFAERTHIKDDKQIILDLKNVKADKKFLRGIDTSEFSGSSVFVSPYKKPGSKNDLRFAIQLRDNVRSFIENKRNRVVLHIENRFGVFSKRKLEKADIQVTGSGLEETDKRLNIPKSGTIQDILANLTLSGVKKYIGKKISINVISVSYPAVLRMIADTSGFNIIIDDAVKTLPPLTLSLTNIPWDEALDTIMSLGKLVAKKHSNILTVQTETKAREEKKLEIERKNLNKIQEPMVTKVFPISFAQPADIVKIIADYLTGAQGNSSGATGGVSSEQAGRAKVDTRTSNIIVRDTVEVIERIKKIIEVLDTETPQILIESKIVEVIDRYELRAGLGGQGIQAGYNPIADLDVIGTETGTFSFSSAPTTGSPNILTGVVSVYKRLTGLNFALQLMESETKGRIVSSPKIITQNNEAATITSDEVRSFLVAAPADPNAGVAPITELTSVTATLSLNVTPRVTNDGSINMKVDITKGSFEPQADPNAPPNQTNNAMSTNVLVDNGSTIVVGGIHTTSTSEVESGIPFLKDLPLIGWLFRSAYNPSSNKAELVVFLTPRIINQEEAGLVNREDTGLGI